MNNSDPFICVVVLTWNDVELSRKSIKSVYENCYKNFKVILVDNGSREPCGKILKEEFPSLDLVELSANRGFSGGANAGLSKALEYDCEYVFFLNNDTYVHNVALDELQNAMELHQDSGLASALLKYPGSKYVGFYQAITDRDCAMHYFQNFKEEMDNREWPTIETEFAPACAIMLRSEALQQVGLFDESLGTCWEDYDFCIRLQDAGWKLLTVGSAIVEHETSSTTGRNSPYITYYFVRNRLICLSRYANKWRTLKKSHIVIRTLWWQIRDYGYLNWKCHLSFVRGFWDFANGKRGESYKISKSST